MDENVEWNFWPHPFAGDAFGRAGLRAGLNMAVPTNR
jgi:hypothetical protein